MGAWYITILRLSLPGNLVIAFPPIVTSLLNEYDLQQLPVQYAINWLRYDWSREIPNETRDKFRIQNTSHGREHHIGWANTNFFSSFNNIKWINYFIQNTGVCSGRIDNQLEPFICHLEIFRTLGVTFTHSVLFVPKYTVPMSVCPSVSLFLTLSILCLFIIYIFVCLKSNY